MVVECITDTKVNLTKGKQYNVIKIDKVYDITLFTVKNDDNIECPYYEDRFKIVEGC